MPRSATPCAVALLVAVAVAVAEGAGACDSSTLPLAGDGGGAGGACARDPDCRLGAICAAHTCTPGCRTSRDCPAGQLCDPSRGPYGACLSGGSAPDGGVRPVDAAPPPADAHVGDDGCVYTETPLLANGGFESLTTSWTLGGSARVLPGGTLVTPHAGAFMAEVGADLANSGVSQGIAPSGSATSLVLSGWVWIRTSEPSGSGAKDVLDFEETDFLGAHVFAQLTNVDASSGWVPFSFPLNKPFFGDFGYITELAIVMTNDTQNLTAAYLDDLVLTQTVCR